MSISHAKNPHQGIDSLKGTAIEAALCGIIKADRIGVSALRKKAKPVRRFSGLVPPV